MAAQFHWNPDTYLEQIRAGCRASTSSRPRRSRRSRRPRRACSSSGIGTGETTKRLLEAYPDAWVIGLDSDSNMIYRLREEYDELQHARMEDPLPDGPWDLVISVLAVHHLKDPEKQTLFRRVREQAKALVIGDVVKAEKQVTPIDPETDFLDTAGELAEWCGGEVTWTGDDLAVVGLSTR